MSHLTVTLRDILLECENMPGSRILVVEDDDAIRYVLAEALTDEGFEVSTVPDGAAALACLEGFRPDLIILDSRMPVMDGYKFLQKYRRRPGPQVPTVGLKADSGHLPVDILLAKPFDLNELIAVVRARLASPAG